MSNGVTALHRTALHRTALHRTALHRTALHYTGQHDTARHRDNLEPPQPLALLTALRYSSLARVARARRFGKVIERQIDWTSRVEG